MSMQNIRLSIAGMSCAGCVANVEKALREVDGVKEASVNFAEHTAAIAGDAPAGTLIQAVRSAGYDAAEMLQDDSGQLDEQKQQEQAQYRRLIKQAVAAALVGIPLFVSGMSGYLPALDSVEGQLSWLLIGALCLAVLIYSGRHFYSGAWKAFLHHNANMDTLIALGTGTAWLYSTVVVIFCNYLPENLLHVYYEAAVIIIAFINLGSALEARARGRTSEAIQRLIGLQVKTASVIRDGIETQVPIEQVGLDEILKVRPGEAIAVDGEIIEGESYVDESMLTGEPMPVAKSPGEKVSAGTINKTGGFLFRSQRIGKDTALARIIDMVRTAQTSKPEIGRLADKVAAVFVPVVLIIAVITFLTWMNLGQGITLALVATITVLIIACPCALGLATPISIMLAVGKAAELGILVRNGNALQQASKLTSVVLDKTGTVTQGRPVVTEVISSGTVEQDTLLQLATSIEAYSEHPLANAVMEAAKERRLTALPVTGFRALPGLGVQGEIEGKIISCGNEKFMVSLAVDVKGLPQLSGSSAVSSRIYLARNDQLIGVIHVDDPLKPDSVDAVKQLKNEKIKVILLTGDNRKTAEIIGKNLEVDQVVAEVMPDDKIQLIRQLQQSGDIVAMVGDGINDAPALAQADVGIAIGTGTDVAIESADVTLMGNSLNSVIDVISLSRKTVSNIKQNLFGAFFYNAMAIPVAAGVLYPLSGLLLNPMLAGAAMALSSLTVVTNASRIRSFRGV